MAGIPSIKFEQMVESRKSANDTTHPLLSTESFEKLNNRKIKLFMLDLTDPSAAHPEWVYNFRNSPDEFVELNPSRSGVTQARGGYWVEDFGPGIKEIQVRGHTGFKKLNLDGETLDGKQSFNKLKGLYTEYNDMRRSKYDLSEDFRKIKMVFHMAADDVTVVVHPMNFTVKRSKSNPLLYMYEMRLIVLGNYIDLIAPPFDQVLEALRKPKERIERIKFVMKQEMVKTLTTLIKHPELKAGWDLQAQKALGNSISLYTTLIDPLKEQSTESSTMVVGDFEYESKKLFEVSVAEGYARDFVREAKLSEGLAVAQGLSNSFKVLSDEEDDVVSKAGALISLPSKTISWTVADIHKHVTGPEGIAGTINSYVTGPLDYTGQGVYELTHNLRALETCIASIINYPEMLKQSYEYRVQQALSSTGDSGCATTLRV